MGLSWMTDIMTRDLIPLGRSPVVESTVNQVISKRFCKNQQMAWTPCGAHRLLQIRTRVLNRDWEATFQEWYPGFRAAPQPMAA
jgi:hypothetical protein